MGAMSAHLHTWFYVMLTLEAGTGSHARLEFTDQARPADGAPGDAPVGVSPAPRLQTLSSQPRKSRFALLFALAWALGNQALALVLAFQDLPTEPSPRPP